METPLQKFISSLRKAFHVAAPDADPAELNKAFDEATAALNEEVVEDDTPAITKGATDEQVAAIAKAQADIAKAQAENAALREEVTKLNARETERVTLAKAKEVLGDVTGATAEEFNKAWIQLNDEGKATVEKILKAAGALVKDSKILEEIGKRGDRAASTNEKLDAKAADLQKAFPTMTKEQAITKALEIDPSLYEAK